MSQENYVSAVDIIKNVCSSIEGYTFVFGAEKLPSVLADRSKLPCVYLDEYRAGWYNTGNYGSIIPYKNTVMDLYFIYRIDPSDILPERLVDARENARDVLEDTGVRVFMEKFNAESVRRNYKCADHL